MNRKIYTGNINEVDNSGRKLIWNGRGYMYISLCKKEWRTKRALEEHEWYCERCHEIQETFTGQGEILC